MCGTIIEDLLADSAINIQLIQIPHSLTSRIKLIPSIGNQHSHADKWNGFSRDGSNALCSYPLGSGSDAFIEPVLNSWADILQDLGRKMGPYPGVETPLTPDGLDGNVVRARAWGHWPGVGLSSASG
jgi:hypothetical protein